MDGSVDSKLKAQRDELERRKEALLAKRNALNSKQGGGGGQTASTSSSSCTTQPPAAAAAPAGSGSKPVVPSRAPPVPSRSMPSASARKEGVLALPAGAAKEGEVPQVSHNLKEAVPQVSFSLKDVFGFGGGGGGAHDGVEREKERGRREAVPLGKSSRETACEGSSGQGHRGGGASVAAAPPGREDDGSNLGGREIEQERDLKEAHEAKTRAEREFEDMMAQQEAVLASTRDELERERKALIDKDQFAEEIGEELVRARQELDSYLEENERVTRERDAAVREVQEIKRQREGEEAARLGGRRDDEADVAGLSSQIDEARREASKAKEGLRKCMGELEELKSQRGASASSPSSAEVALYASEAMCSSLSSESAALAREVEALQGQLEAAARREQWAEEAVGEAKAKVAAMEAVHAEALRLAREAEAGKVAERDTSIAELRQELESAQQRGEGEKVLAEGVRAKLEAALEIANLDLEIIREEKDASSLAAIASAVGEGGGSINAAALQAGIIKMYERMRMLEREMAPTDRNIGIGDGASTGASNLSYETQTLQHEIARLREELEQFEEYKLVSGEMEQAFVESERQLRQELLQMQDNCTRLEVLKAGLLQKIEDMNEKMYERGSRVQEVSMAVFDQDQSTRMRIAEKKVGALLCALAREREQLIVSRMIVDLQTPTCIDDLQLANCAGWMIGLSGALYLMLSMISEKRASNDLQEAWHVAQADVSKAVEVWERVMAAAWVGGKDIMSSMQRFQLEVQEAKKIVMTVCTRGASLIAEEDLKMVRECVSFVERASQVVRSLLSAEEWSSLSLSPDALGAARSLTDVGSTECLIQMPGDLQSRKHEITAETKRQAGLQEQLEILKRDLRDVGVTLREKDEELLALSLQAQMSQHTAATVSVEAEFEALKSEYENFKKDAEEAFQKCV